MNNHLQQLAHLRLQIDSLDSQLIDLLARRAQVATRIGQLKQQHQLEPLDPKRWQQVLESRIATAQQLGLPPNLIESIYHSIHQHSLSIQQKEQR